MGEAARAYVTLDQLTRLKVRAKGFSFLPRQPVHSLLAGRHASRLRGRGLDFAELRHYFEGDDTRSIDWAATARLGSPHVRVFTEERDRAVLLLVDQRLSMFFGSALSTKSVAAAEAAALAAWRVTSLGDRVGAIVFSENGITEIKPRPRDGAVPMILDALVRHNSRLSASDPRAADPALFNEALRRAGRLVTHDGLVTLISDAYGADQASVELATRIGARNDLLSIFIHDPLEENMPDIGRVVMAEAGQWMEVDTGARRLRADFAAGFLARRAALASFARKRAIPVLPISTAQPVIAQLRALLGRRLAHATEAVRGA